jgi:hypothetical protein
VPEVTDGNIKFKVFRTVMITFTLMTEAAGPFETLVTTRQPTCFDNKED